MTLKLHNSLQTQSFSDVHEDNRKENDNREDLDLRLVIISLHFHLIFFFFAETLSK